MSTIAVVRPLSLAAHLALLAGLLAALVAPLAALPLGAPARPAPALNIAAWDQIAPLLQEAEYQTLTNQPHRWPCSA